MFICWAILIPIGGFLARFMKRFPWWFNVHRLINSTALGIMLIGFLLAVIMTTDHFNSEHKIIGKSDFRNRLFIRLKLDCLLLLNSSAGLNWLRISLRTYCYHLGLGAACHRNCGWQVVEPRQRKSPYIPWQDTLDHRMGYSPELSRIYIPQNYLLSFLVGRFILNFLQVLSSWHW